MFDISKVYHCFATDPDTAYFWSGLGPNGDKIAASVAQSRGGTTLEMVMDAHKQELIDAGFEYDFDLDAFVYDGNSPQNVENWRQVSQAYAEQAKGDVHAVLGDNVREDSIWNTREKGALIENEDVYSITTVEPSTGVDVEVIYDRAAEEAQAEADREAEEMAAEMEAEQARLQKEAEAAAEEEMKQTDEEVQKAAEEAQAESMEAMSDAEIDAQVEVETQYEAQVEVEAEVEYDYYYGQGY